MQSIEITSLVGHSPFSITVCDMTYTYCYFVISGVTSAPITITPPLQLNGVNQLLVVITDSKGCETMNYINCFTPTPTPTLTPTPTITPTNISCNCIAFINVGVGNLNFGYTDCYGITFTGIIPQSTTFYFCGKLPFADTNVNISVNDICINNSCQTAEITPTPTPTMTPTPTSVTVVPDCAVLYNVSSDVYYYNVSTNTSTLLTIPGFPSDISGDIAHTLDKLWGADDPYQRFVEYDITLSPFSATFNRNISYSGLPFVSSYGLAAISNTVILAVNANDFLNQVVVEIDVSDGNNPIMTTKFPLIVGRFITGDFYKTTTNKFIALNTDYATSKCYVTQWDYLTGGLPEVDIELTIPCDTFGLFEDNGNIYITESTSSTKLYSIDKDSPYAITEVCVITPLTINGASQIPSCLNNNFTPYKFLPNGEDLISYIDNGSSAYFYGYFTGYSENNTSSNHIIKLNQDLTIDTSFNVGTGFNEVNYNGEGIIQQPDGKLVGFGTFTSYNGTSSVRIIRLNTDGSIDTSFVTGSGFYGSSVSYAVGPVIDSLGNIIVPGRYTQYNGVAPPMSYLTKLNSNGVMDMTFSATTSFNNVTVSSLINSDDSMFVGGYFTSFSGVSANRIIKLKSTGKIDFSFTGATGFNNNVFGFARISGETSFYVFGSFTTYKGVSSNRIIKLNLDGTIDNSFTGGTGFNNTLYTPYTIIWVNKLLLYGTFTSYNGTPSLGYIILNSDGTIFQSFPIQYEVMFAIGDKLYGSEPNGYLQLLMSYP